MEFILATPSPSSVDNIAYLLTSSSTTHHNFFRILSPPFAMSKAGALIPPDRAASNALGHPYMSQ
jgi:hypothetical protein